MRSPYGDSDASSTSEPDEVADAVVIGAGPKLVLRSETRGLGIAVSASLGYGVERHRLETASVTVPLTIPVSSWLRWR